MKLNNASLAVEEIVYFYTHIFNGVSHFCVINAGMKKQNIIVFYTVDLVKLKKKRNKSEIKQKW